jgi:lipoprotein-releasing system ATP-binding protein
MPDPILRVRGVTKDYGDHIVTRVLRGIDLEVQPGEFVALTGPSGSGKSTLLNLIGLLDHPTSGEIWMRDTATGGLDDDHRTRLRARDLGFVFQFHHLLPAFTALENVMLPLLSLRGRRDQEMKQRATDLLREVGLTSRLDAPAADLSGGEQQRVALARALVMDPAVVLADEPTGNLDSENGELVLELLLRFNRQYGTAVLIVTHDDRIAARCDRIVHLVDGRIEWDRRSA